MSVHINESFCKSCLYCINFCPKKVLELGSVRNDKGYFTPEVKSPENCISCAVCATVCPEGAIEITKDD